MSTLDRSDSSSLQQPRPVKIDFVVKPVRNGALQVTYLADDSVTMVGAPLALTSVALLTYWGPSVVRYGSPLSWRYAMNDPVDRPGKNAAACGPAALDARL